MLRELHFDSGFCLPPAFRFPQHVSGAMHLRFGRAQMGHTTPALPRSVSGQALNGLMRGADRHELRTGGSLEC